VTDPVIVLVLLLSADASDPATQAVVPALRGPLGADAVVLVQASEALPPDPDAVALARQLHALSTVTVAWEDGARTHVHVRVLLTEGAKRYDYELAFHPEDSPLERGRAIGLTATPALTWAIGSARRRAVTPAALEPETQPKAPAPEAPPAEAAPPRSPPQGRITSAVSVDLASCGSVGIGGNALGAGPELGARASVLGGLSLHAVGLLRFGPVEAASATAMSLGAGGGLAVRVAQVGGGVHPLELGARADVLAMQIGLAQDAGGTQVWRSRWLTAVDLLAEAAWPLGPHFALAAAVGVEVTTGPTSVTVGGAPVDTIPVVRAIAELGVRIPF
jgi:hypothetical protein